MHLNTFPEIFSQNSNAIGSHEYLTCPPTWWKNSPPNRKEQGERAKETETAFKGTVGKMSPLHTTTKSKLQKQRSRDRKPKERFRTRFLSHSLFLRILPPPPDSRQCWSSCNDFHSNPKKDFFFFWGDLDEEMRFGTKVLGLFLKWVCTVGGKFCEVSQIEWKDGL